MMGDEREEKSNVEREEAPRSQQSASFHPVYHPKTVATACSAVVRGECPWEFVACQGKQIIDKVLLKVGLAGCSLHKIGIVTAAQECSVPRMECKGSSLENVGPSIRRKMLICP